MDGTLYSDWADALLRRRADELARSPAATDEVPTMPLLIGRGSDGLYGMDLRRLARIVPLPRVARVPGAPPEMLGLIAIDGRVMRIFDADRLCGRTVVPAGGGFAVVLRDGAVGGGEAGGRARPVALRLRGVETVTEVDPGRLAAPPEAGPYITAILENRVAVLNIGAILDRLRSTGEE